MIFRYSFERVSDTFQTQSYLTFFQLSLSLCQHLRIFSLLSILLDSEIFEILILFLQVGVLKQGSLTFYLNSVTFQGISEFPYFSWLYRHHVYTIDRMQRFTGIALYQGVQTVVPQSNDDVISSFLVPGSKFEYHHCFAVLGSGLK